MEKTLLSCNIRTMRRQKHLTQLEFAALIGRSTARVIHLESGEEPTPEEITALCQVLDVTEDVLRCEKL